MSEGQFVLTAIGTIVAALVALIAAIWLISYNVDKGRCSTWGLATNRATRFVVLNQPAGVPLTWDCFTPDEGGRWIPTDRVRDID